jgi:hypothetical protein
MIQGGEGALWSATSKDVGGTARGRLAYARIVSHMLSGCFAGTH